MVEAREIEKLQSKYATELDEAKEAFEEWYSEQESGEWLDYDTVMAEHDGWMRGNISTLERVLVHLGIAHRQAIKLGGLDNG